jgi:hypothetical protein
MKPFISRREPARDASGAEGATGVTLETDERAWSEPTAGDGGMLAAERMPRPLVLIRQRE